MSERNISTASCKVCGHLAADHAKEGLAPCKRWPEVSEGNRGHQCPCPNFVLDENSIDDGISHAELDRKFYEFVEMVGFAAEELKRIADVLEYRWGDAEKKP